MTSQARQSADQQPPAFPGVLKRLAAALLEPRYAEALPGELIYDGHAAIFLQALLTACSHDTCVRPVLLLVCMPCLLTTLNATALMIEVVTRGLLTCCKSNIAC